MNGRNYCTGFSLIEVLITMIIIAVGLMGIAGLQARGQQAELESYERSQALILVDDMVNRIKANRTIADCYAFAGFVGSGEPAPNCTSYANSDRRDRVDTDLAEWVNALNGASEFIDNGASELSDQDHIGSITGARGCITHENTNNIFTVSVAWQGSSLIQGTQTNQCAVDEYGDDRQRRVVSASFRIADLQAN